MESAIEKIMFGKGKTEGVKPTREQCEAAEAESVCEDAVLALLQTLPGGEAAYLKYREALEKRELTDGIGYYKSGFRFGFMLALDVRAGECAENGKN